MKVALLTTDAREHWREYDKPEPYFGPPQEALLQGAPEVADLELHVVSCWQKPMRAPEKLAPNVWFHPLLVPKIGWLRTGYQGCIRAVRKKLRQLQPDVVHGQGTERDCAISAALSGFPNVITIHGNMIAIAQLMRARPFSFLWSSARVERFTLPRTDGVVCITRYTQAQVQALTQRTWVVPNAVDSAFFGIKNVPATPPEILCVANIQKRKNQLGFIRALDPLAKESSFVVRFYGKYEQDDPFAREFFELVGQRPWCQYGGFADRPTLKSLLSRAALLVLPSLEDNCPMSVLEAMAAGVPVVAAKVGGVPDLFDDGVSGLFCDPLDPVSIRTAIQKVLTQPALAGKLAANGRQHAAERFRPDVIMRRHMEVYREVAGLRSRS